MTISSIAGLAAAAALSDYAASKFGTVGLDESLRYELRSQGMHSYIKTTCIMPYLINTGMMVGAKVTWPLYFLEPDEVAKRVVDAIG